MDEGEDLRHQKDYTNKLQLILEDMFEFNHETINIKEE